MNGLYARTAAEFATNRREHPDIPSVRDAVSRLGRNGPAPERRFRSRHMEWIPGT